MTVFRTLDQFLGRRKLHSMRQGCVAFLFVGQLAPVSILSVFVCRFLPFWLAQSLLGVSGAMVFCGLFAINSYATLGMLLCCAGFMLPVVLERSPVSWSIGVPAFCLGLLCLVQYLRWRDKDKQAKKALKHHSEDRADGGGGGVR